MLIAGLLVLIAGIAVLRSNHEVLRGTLVPIVLMLVMLFGYGGFLTFGRPAHTQKVITAMSENPREAVVVEDAKAQKDNKAYTLLKKVWPILIVLAALLFFAAKPYLKGLSIGLVLMFCTVLVVDVCLHHRLQLYMQGIAEAMATG